MTRIAEIPEGDLDGLFERVADGEIVPLTVGGKPSGAVAMSRENLRICRAALAATVASIDAAEEAFERHAPSEES